jgi:Skp family chaperone for outer membrane proteins
MGRRRSITQKVIWIAALIWAPFPILAQETGIPSPGGMTGLAPAQSLSPPTAPTGAASGILVLNQEQLLSQSRMGRRIQAEFEDVSRTLAAENRDIEARLMEEELQLTAMRPNMPVAEFAELADEFDTRVEGIRRAQEAKARELQTQADAAQNAFFELAFPFLLQIVQSRGAQVLMDNRSVLLSSDGVDITQAAIALIDAELGDGGPDPLIDLYGAGAASAP